VVVFFSILILLFAFVPLAIKIGVTFNADILKNVGKVSIRLWGIRVFKIALQVKFIDGYISVVPIEKSKKNIGNKQKKNKKREQREIHLNTNRKDKKSISVLLFSPLLEKLYIPTAKINLKFGIANDAFLSVLSFQTICFLIDNASLFLQVNFNTKIEKKYDLEFNQNIFELNSEVENKIYIRDLIVGLFKHLMHKINNKTKFLKGKQNEYSR